MSYLFHTHSIIIKNKYVNRGTAFFQTPGGPFGLPSLQIGGARPTKGIADGDQTVRQKPGTGREDVKDDHESTPSSSSPSVGRTRPGAIKLVPGSGSSILLQTKLPSESTHVGRTRLWRLSSGAGSGTSMNKQSQQASFGPDQAVAPSRGAGSGTSN